MQPDAILERVDAERLYSDILEIEGVKHALDNPEKMEECADYILTSFEALGVATNEQVFSVKGFDYEFRNIEAWLGDGKGPEILIASHYDTVAHAPGANDNGSAIAVMLESARVLSETDTTGIRFVSFNLEEGNPASLLAWRTIMREMGLTDESNRWKSLRAKQAHDRFQEVASQKYEEGLPREEIRRAAFEAMKDYLAQEEAAKLEELLQSQHAEGLMQSSGGLQGSTHWVSHGARTGRQVTGMLCLETIGYTSTKPNSQSLPSGIRPEMFQLYNTSEDASIGDFLTIVGDRNSEQLAQDFARSCRSPLIELPHAMLTVPMGYVQIKKTSPHLLRSDHAPFWKAEMPALLLTDTADFRYPYYHTRADTIDKLDFNFLTRVCQATVLTALNHSSSL
ncbi:M28 family peptidase [Candidatus Thorarchaeota archaeon]|nr:MAG: M28 family peptidase [Candidatus Thorarchaeota archaeon]